MKRIIIICALICGTLSAFAQERAERSTYSSDTTRYLASTLGQNWFVSINGSVNWWQGSDRNPAGNYTQLNGPTFGTGVAVGKWITHSLALRLSYDIHRSHSFINGLHTNLPNLQFLFNEGPTPDENGYYNTSFMFHNLHGDVLLSPVDLILGYYDDRFYTPVVAFGMGVACVSEHFFVTQTLIQDGWNKNKNLERSAFFGLINNFKMNKNFDLVLSTTLTASRFSIDSWTSGEYGAAGEAEPRPRKFDLNYAVDLGLTWNISGNDQTGSRIYELPYNYSNEMREMRRRINHLEEELEECMRHPHYDTVIQVVSSGVDPNAQAVTDTVTEIVSFPFSIFFNLDSYELMSGRDLVNLREIARVALEKGWKIRLRGSCDSATATAQYNQVLAENRCLKIQDELFNMGVPREQTILVPVGGVSELNPTEYDRRVLLELVKEIK